MPHSGSDLDRFLRRMHRRYVALHGRRGWGWARWWGVASGWSCWPCSGGRGGRRSGRRRRRSRPARASDWPGASPAGRDCSMRRRKPTGNSGWPISWARASPPAMSSSTISPTPGPRAGGRRGSDVRTLGPSAVVLNPLGARAWGGIGLATALLLTLALLAGSPADTRAAGRMHPAGPRAMIPQSNNCAQPEHPLLAAGAPRHRPAGVR